MSQETTAATPLPPSPAADVCYAYLVRHGATDASSAKPVRMQGRGTDDSLSESGRRQAHETGQFLAESRLDAVYSSPMRRALETANAIGEPHGLAVTAVEELIEADLGRWEGLTWPEIEARDHEAYRQFIARPDLHGYGGGESITQMRDRARPAIERLMRGHLGHSIAICTHRIVIRACVADLLGMPLAESRRLSPSNCGLSLLRLRKDTVEVMTFNALFHLSAW
ncbi:MAG: histidine phosphatase family protein [Planctomycetia bacterium]|nr:histidine phosphatase family protein [Planctomycetia bacterium]